MTEPDTIPAEPRKNRPWIKKLLLLAVVLVITATIVLQFRETLSVDYLASQESQLRQWQLDFPLLAAITGVGTYVAVAGLSLPGAAVLTLVYGWYFGFWEGLLVVSFGSTGGAMLAFLLSRYLLRDWVQSKLQDRLTRINAACSLVL